MRPLSAKFIVLYCLVALAFVLLLFSGEVPLVLKDFMQGLDEVQGQIFWELRMPKATTAAFAGATLAISGLLLQAFFQNPLAEPFVLGIHGAASLGIVVWLALQEKLRWLNLFGSWGYIAASSLSSLLLMAFMLFISWRTKEKSFLLIVGLLVSYLVGGIINIFISVTGMEKLKLYLMWSLGSFQQVGSIELPWFVASLTALMILAFLLVKPLDALTLGDSYAQALGASLKKTKLTIVLVVAFVSALITSFCGPIAFIGLMAPHMARGLFQTGRHQVLLPATLGCGALLALLAQWSSDHFPFLPPGSTLPVNALLSLLGAPVLFLLLWKMRKEGA